MCLIEYKRFSLGSSFSSFFWLFGFVSLFFSLWSFMLRNAPNHCISFDITYTKEYHCKRVWKWQREQNSNKWTKVYGAHAHKRALTQTQCVLNKNVLRLLIIIIVGVFGAWAFLHCSLSITVIFVVVQAKRKEQNKSGTQHRNDGPNHLVCFFLLLAYEVQLIIVGFWRAAIFPLFLPFFLLVLLVS